MIQFLDPSSEAQLKDTRALLATLRDNLIQFGAAPADQSALIATIRQLDELFLLVVVGEFNAGKSAFINALLGDGVLAEGVTPTTADIQVLKYGPSTTDAYDDVNRVRVISAPVELLRDLQIVDTPGTNAIIREHERLTTDFVPRADLVLFVTSADRPFTETERAFMESIRDWGKKIVVILNKIDIFASATELNDVLGFVRSGARRLLGVETPVLPVSARLAQHAKHGDPSQWEASRFGALSGISSTRSMPRTGSG